MISDFKNKCMQALTHTAKMNHKTERNLRCGGTAVGSALSPGRNRGSEAAIRNAVNIEFIIY